MLTACLMAVIVAVASPAELVSQFRVESNHHAQTRLLQSLVDDGWQSRDTIALLTEIARGGKRYVPLGYSTSYERHRLFAVEQLGLMSQVKTVPIVVDLLKDSAKNLDGQGDMFAMCILTLERFGHVGDKVLPTLDDLRHGRGMESLTEANRELARKKAAHAYEQLHAIAEYQREKARTKAARRRPVSVSLPRD